MDYRRVYFSIINNARSRGDVRASKRSKLEGYEKHHILPRCAGGTNDPSNLVFLTTREHFICHALLVKFCEPQHLKSLQYALGMMRSRGKVVSSRLYEFARNQHRQAITSARIGSRHSEETKLKISLAHKGRKRSKEHCENTRLSQLGKTLSPDHRKKLGDATRGRSISYTLTEKQLAPKPSITCPHCGKIGGKGAMNRWHFNNCPSRA